MRAPSEERMHALGHDSRSALGRYVLTFPKNPKAGLNMRAQNGTTYPSLKVSREKHGINFDEHVSLD